MSEHMCTAVVQSTAKINSIEASLKLMKPTHSILSDTTNIYLRMGEAMRKVVMVVGEGVGGGRLVAN